MFMKRNVKITEDIVRGCLNKHVHWKKIYDQLSNKYKSLGYKWWVLRPDVIYAFRMMEYYLEVAKRLNKEVVAYLDEMDAVMYEE